MFAPTTGPDQIETGTAYHALPESHMKATLQMPKCHAPKYLALPCPLRRINGESLAYRKASSFLSQAGGSYHDQPGIRKSYAA